VLPRFDAPAVFARILDPAGGHFAIRPVGEFEASRCYLTQTMVLETTFRTAVGTAVLTDAMAVGRNERGHELGAESPGVLRELACTDGEIDVEISYAPRPEYGLIHPILEGEGPGDLGDPGRAARFSLFQADVLGGPGLAIMLAPRLGAEERVTAWTTARDEIRAVILEHGWSEQAGAFTQAFGGEDLDASNLMLVITGFLPGTTRG
jgi:GH15 family glucan-1,4-alpha-glucosidase